MRAAPRQIDTDVIVVGAGGAGLFAAIEAARCGKAVALLEKNAEPGGTTVWSIGSLTSSGSPLQAAAGIEDTPQAHFEDMGKFLDERFPPDNLELRRLLVEHVPETLRQLIDMGLVFFGPTAEPPHRVPRMHNVLPNSRAYGYYLMREARRRGVNFHARIAARRLVVSDGIVCGVSAEDASGAPVEFWARHGIVLAAGDFSGSQEMKRHYISPEVATVQPINPSNTGDGHRLALELGAVILNGHILDGPQLRFVPPGATLLRRLPPYRIVSLAMKLALRGLPQWALRPLLMKFITTLLQPHRSLFDSGALLVNKLGRRFVDECESPHRAIHQQPDGLAYIVLDDELARRYSQWPHFISTAPGVAYAYLPDYRRNRRDIYSQAATLESLCEKLGMPRGSLAETIAQANARPDLRGAPLMKPPFHALGPVATWITITEGGLKVDAQHRVLKADGAPIPGLFAAGGNGQGGLLLEGHGHHLGWAFTSGRLSGRHAAAFRR